MTVTIGTSTWPIKLSDSDDAFIWYLKGAIVAETWDFKPLVAVETGNDSSMQVNVGQFAWTTVIKDVVIKSKTEFDKIKRATRYWNDNDNLLSFQSKLGGVDNGYWSNSDWDAADDRIYVKIIKIVWKTQMVDNYTGDVYVKRFTS